MTARTRSTAALLALALAALAPAGAQERQEPPKPGTPKDFTIPKPQRFTLDNGLRVTLVPFGQVPKVTVSLVVAAANLHENKDQVWLADLTGSLMREGTATRTADALARELAGMGGQLNLSVGPDTATISTEVLSERAADAVRVIAEVARQPRMPESEMDRLKSDLLRTLAIQRSTPQAMAQERFSQLVYGDHPYGRFFPEDAALKGYTIDQVRAFHRTHYTAVRSRLYVAGVFEAPALERAVKDGFGGWERGEAAAAVPAADAGATRFALIDRKDAPQSTLRLGLKVPPPSHADWVPLQVMNALLGGSFGSRITNNIREQKGYTYSPFSTLTSHPGQAHWVENADVTTDVTGASLKEIFGEIDRLRREAPPAAELRGIQNYLAGIFVLQNGSRAGVIGQLAFVDLHGLGDGYLSSYVQRVMSVTPQEVRRVADAYLPPDRMTLVVVGDTTTVKDQVTPWAAR